MLDVSSAGRACMTFSADELLNLAIMTSTPLVIVEGADDLPIYQRLSNAVQVETDIYASENILCRKEGCVGVIDNIGLIRQVAGDDFPIEKHVLGIIDRDARYYRGELPDDKAILVLNYYSIESHFVCVNTIKYLLPDLTRAVGLLKDEQYLKIFENIKSKLFCLYLASLEALRNACDSQYESLVGYSTPLMKILRTDLCELIEGRREALLSFAEDKGIRYSWDTLLLICKGKWLHDFFTMLLHEEISQLPVHCQASAVVQCQFCLNGEHTKCLYKTTAFLSADILKQASFRNVSIEGLDYIRNRITGMIH